MKRASLKVTANSSSVAASDLTDRLLKNDSPKAAPQPGKRATRRPKVKTAGAPRPVGEPALRTESPPPPVSPVSESQAVLTDALNQSQAALEALKRAALAEPSRYELALRYRLDALAHHLQQVRDFVYASKRGG